MHLKKICPIQNFSLGVCTQIQMIVSKPYFSLFFFFNPVSWNCFSVTALGPFE